LQKAEQQLIGALLLRPELFHAALADGRTLDEALTPADLETPDAAKLYQCITSRLMDQRELTLNAVLGDLAEAGQLELSSAATRAAELVADQTGSEVERLLEMVRGAAKAILAHQRRREYEESRAAAVSGADRAADEAELRRIQEHNRANPSPMRIGRVSA
jgi:choline dehydrogenase-like flavoprotein